MKKAEYEEWKSNPELKKDTGFEVALLDYDEETGTETWLCETCYTYERFKEYITDLRCNYSVEVKTIEAGDYIVLAWAYYS